MLLSTEQGAEVVTCEGRKCVECFI